MSDGRGATALGDTQTTTVKDPSEEDNTFRSILYEDPLANVSEVIGPYPVTLAHLREFKLTSRTVAKERAMRQESDLPLYELPIDDEPLFANDLPTLDAKAYAWYAWPYRSLSVVLEESRRQAVQR